MSVSFVVELPVPIAVNARQGDAAEVTVRELTAARGGVE